MTEELNMVDTALLIVASAIKRRESRGGHFRRASGELAVQVALDFLGHFGLIERTPRADGVTVSRPSPDFSSTGRSS